MKTDDTPFIRLSRRFAILLLGSAEALELGDEATSEKLLLEALGTLARALNLTPEEAQVMVLRVEQAART